MSSGFSLAARRPGGPGQAARRGPRSGRDGRETGWLPCWSRR